MWTLDKVKQLNNFCARGLTVSEIAEKLDETEATVRIQLAKSGLRNTQVYNETQVPLIKELYFEKGFDLGLVASKLNLTPKYVASKITLINNDKMKTVETTKTIKVKTTTKSRAGASAARWTEQEDVILKMLVNKHVSREKIAKILNRTTKAVTSRVYIKNLVDAPQKVMPRKVASNAWTQEEVDTLQIMSNAGATVGDIADVVGKTKKAVIVKRGKINAELRRAGEAIKASIESNKQAAPISQTKWKGRGATWTQEDIDYLMNARGLGMDFKTIANKLGRTRSTTENTYYKERKRLQNETKSEPIVVETPTYKVEVSVEEPVTTQTVTETTALQVEDGVITTQVLSNDQVLETIKAALESKRRFIYVM